MRAHSAIFVFRDDFTARHTAFIGGSIPPGLPNLWSARQIGGNHEC
jgi:hypothetical protein